MLRDEKSYKELLVGLKVLFLEFWILSMELKYKNEFAHVLPTKLYFCIKEKGF